MHHAFIDRFSNLESSIHRLDPRAKIISLFFFVVMVVLSPPGDLFRLSLFFALILSVLFLSNVPLGYIFRHSLIILPFAGVVGLSLLFSNGGAELFLSVLLKSWLSALAMLTLVSTTPFPALLRGFGWLGVPSLILMIISFMYRYVFLLTDEMIRIRAARDSRGRSISVIGNLKTAGCMIGVLFVRSYERAERVYLAMSARCFDGKARTLYDFRLNSADVLFISLFSIFAFLIMSFGWPG